MLFYSWVFFYQQKMYFLTCEQFLVYDVTKWMCVDCCSSTYNNFLLLWIWFVGFHCCCCCCCCKVHSTFHIKISFFLFSNFIPSLFGKQFIRIFLRGGLSKNITSIFCRHSIKKSKPWMKNVSNQKYLEFIGKYEIRLFCLLGNWLKLYFVINWDNQMKIKHMQKYNFCSKL